MHHPWLCGFLFAFALAASQVIGTPVNLLDSSDGVLSLTGGGDPASGPLLLALAVAAGSLIASLPGRLRSRGKARTPVSVRRCAVCYAGGLLTALGLALARGDLLTLAFTGVFNGTAGGAVFAVIAAVSGSIAASAAERRRA